MSPCSVRSASGRSSLQPHSLPTPPFRVGGPSRMTSLLIRSLLPRHTLGKGFSPWLSKAVLSGVGFAFSVPPWAGAVALFFTFSVIFPLHFLPHLVYYS